jgi:probable F420-dependent oxidoreductase
VDQGQEALDESGSEVLMQYAVTLPQGGRAANPEGIRATAVRAEELGYSHLWVNDHITVPEGQKYPSPFIFDPLMTLAHASGVTTTIGLGAQLTAAYYTPMWLANALASLDNLSGGRVLASIGVGWSKAEFDALESDFSTRGARTDEIISIMRTVWEQDHVAIDTHHYHLPPVKVAPKPAHRIPLWIAGSADVARRRAVAIGDGFHPEMGIAVELDGVADDVKRFRADRPEESFTYSVYTTHWDLSQRPEKEVLEERDILADAGVQHVVISLVCPDGSERFRVMERLADLLGVAEG